MKLWQNERPKPVEYGFHTAAPIQVPKITTTIARSQEFHKEEIGRDEY
jgi:hypothetical protein